MKSNRFSFYRATKCLGTSILLFLCLFVIACSQDDDDKPFSDPLASCVKLSESDPIYGEFTGNFGDMCFTKDLAFSTCANATHLEDVSTLNENQYSTFEIFDYFELVYVDNYFAKDGEEIYVSYKDLNNKKEGVVIFKTKYSPYDSPQVGYFYGVKFKFFDDGKVWLCGGYNADTIYNTVDTLVKAVEMFGFDNSDYFSSDSWKETVSAGRRK